jgi:hypothetical protein
MHVEIYRFIEQEMHVEIYRTGQIVKSKKEIRAPSQGQSTNLSESFKTC